MKKILLSIYPATMITDLDLGVIQDRMALVPDWCPDLHDARVSDASFVNVILHIPEIRAEDARRLRKVFGHLPRMKTRLWRNYNDEVSLSSITPGTLEAAADTFGKTG